MAFIRQLQPFDLPRYMLFGGLDKGNVVVTLNRLGNTIESSFSTLDGVRLSLLTYGKGTCTYCVVDGLRVNAIAVATQRSGPHVWELSHLVVGSAAERFSEDLLSKSCQEVARRGGERVLVRFREGEPHVNTARRIGFTYRFNELLFEGPSRSISNHREIELRLKQSYDDHNLFRLYCLTYPNKERLLSGVTFDQWASSLEPNRGITREFVYEEGGVVQAWVKTSKRSKIGQLSIMVGPKIKDSLSEIIDFGLAQFWDVNTVQCLVSDKQLLLQRLLPQRGLEVVGEYVTLSKTMVAPVVKETVGRAVPTTT